MKLEDMMGKKAELQIAPLIDVVFLLLIYFMVTAALVKKEADLKFQLPVKVESQIPPTPPLEVLIEVQESGDITIEGMVYDQDSLIAKLMDFKAAADSTASDFVVTIMPDDMAMHGNVIRVMDACSAAQVKNLSFTM